MPKTKAEPKKKRHTVFVTFKEVHMSVEIPSESMEEALTIAREYQHTDLLDATYEGDSVDYVDGVTITGVMA